MRSTAGSGWLGRSRPADVELGGEAAGDVLERGFASKLGLQVPMAEGVEEVEGQYRHEPKVQDRLGAVLVDVIGVPARDDLVEPEILDVPASMAQSDDRLGRRSVRGAGRHPQPL